MDLIQWQNQKGEKISISDLKTDHLFNIVKMLNNHLTNNAPYKKYWDLIEWIDVDRKAVERRRDFLKKELLSRKDAHFYVDRFLFWWRL